MPFVPPAGLGVLVGQIEVHHGGCGFTPVATGIIGFEQRAAGDVAPIQFGGEHTFLS